MHHVRTQVLLVLSLVLSLLACDAGTEFVEPPPDSAMKPRFRTRVMNVANTTPVTDVRLQELGRENVAFSNFDGRASVPIDGNIVVIEHTRGDLLRTVVGVTPEVLGAFNGASQNFLSPMLSETEFCELFPCAPGDPIAPMFAYIVRADMSPATDVEISVVAPHSPPVSRGADGVFRESLVPGPDGLIVFPNIVSATADLFISARCDGLTSIPIELSTLNTGVFVCD